VSALTQTLEIRGAQPEIYRTAEIALYTSVLLALGVGFTDWGAKVTLGSLVALLLAPVAVSMLVWLKRTPAHSG
jgi:hypothetical protein